MTSSRLPLTPALVISFSLAALASNVAFAGYKVVWGKEDQSCKELARKVGAIPRGDLKRGKLTEHLAPDLWRTESITWKFRDGRQIQERYTHAGFDIDNDGVKEAIVTTRGVTQFEHWRIYPMEEFAQGMKNGFSPDLEYSKPLIDTSSVDESKWSSLGNTFMSPWTYGGSNYVVYQDTRFPSERAAVKYSLVLTRFRGPLEREVDPMSSGLKNRVQVICVVHG